MSPLLKYSNGIIDASNLFWHCNSRVDEKKTVKFQGQSVSPLTVKNCFSVIDKFLSSFFHRDSHIYFLFDNPNSKITERKYMDASYKHTRDLTFASPDVFPTLHLFRRMLSYASDRFYICYQDGMEADDLTKPLKNFLSGDRSLFISDDLDWARNIDEKSDWYNWKEIYTRENFQNVYGYIPDEERIKVYKSIRGDKSDSIPPGCPYMPEEIVTYIVNNFTLDLLYTSLDSLEILNEHWKESLLIHRERIYLNYRLVDFLEKKMEKDQFVVDCKNIPSAFEKMLQALQINTGFSIY